MSVMCIWVSKVQKKATFQNKFYSSPTTSGILLIPKKIVDYNKQMDEGEFLEKSTSKTCLQVPT